MNLALRIPDNATVLLDTNPIIYVLEGHPLATRFEPIFADVETGPDSTLVTPITLAEVVSGPCEPARKPCTTLSQHPDQRARVDSSSSGCRHRRASRPPPPTSRPETAGRNSTCNRGSRGLPCSDQATTAISAKSARYSYWTDHFDHS